MDLTEATTQPDIFNPSRDGQPLGGGTTENTVCKGTPFGKTAWFDLTPQSDGAIDVSAAGIGFTPVIVLYEWSQANSQITRMVDCTPVAGGRLALDVKKGRSYTIQLGGAGGIGGAATLSVDYFADSDGDGEYDALDKCPEVAGIARFGGCPPELRVVPSIGFDRTGNGVRISRLIVDRVPKGAKVVAKCSGCGSQTVQREEDRHGLAHQARGQERPGGREHRDPRHARFAAHRDVQVRRDRQLLQVAGAGERARQASDALHRRGDGVEARDLQVRTFAVALLAALAFAAPAQAQLAPPPTVLDFEALQPATRRARLDGSFYPGVTMTTPDAAARPARRPRRPAPMACAYIDERARRPGARVLRQPALNIAFATPQVTVSFWSSAGSRRRGRRRVSSRRVVGRDRRRRRAESTPRAPFGRRRRRSPARASRSVRSCAPSVHVLRATSTIDDLSYSTSRSRTRRSCRSADGRVALNGNQKVDAFECSVDGAEFSPCGSPVTLPQLAIGTHTLRARMIDVYGNEDETPAVYTWAVAGPPLPQPVPCRPLRTRTATACPTRATTARRCRTPTRPTATRDGVGDACEVGSPGTLAPIAGERVNIEVVAGEVFVKFPSGSLKQSSPGFVPLKGQASVPVGSTVDARKGTVAMASAQNSQGTQRNARLSAGIFLIRQQRAKRGSAAVVGIDLVLQSAPGAEAACARTCAQRPDQGALAQHRPQPHRGHDQGSVPRDRRRRDHHRPGRHLGHA